MKSDDFLALKNWAVAGDVLNPDKFAHKIAHKLKSRGYHVAPVHPDGGEGVYTDLASLPSKPEVLCLVINPRVGEQYLEQAAAQGITRVWLQPGADTDAILSRSRALGLEIVQACVLVKLQ
ncbi:MAG: CoA-binding protein [Firmicutes bacterium]|jgi:predicted CoA-binding protein|nr:CoA-binding protein [Dethiobacter sp.]MBS3889777.1 CoA-binding protein [Bacillota bacterium]MBS4054564.1 CoA-binding protein [Thermaerobacter sp.]